MYAIRSYYERPEFFGDNFVMLSIGRLAYEKQQVMMIDALHKSKYKDKIQLLICGKGPSEEELKTKSAATSSTWIGLEYFSRIPMPPGIPEPTPVCP